MASKSAKVAPEPDDDDDDAGAIKAREMMLAKMNGADWKKERDEWNHVMHDEAANQDVKQKLKKQNKNYLLKRIEKSAKRTIIATVMTIKIEVMDHPRSTIFLVFSISPISFCGSSTFATTTSFFLDSFASIV